MIGLRHSNQLDLVGEDETQFYKELASYFQVHRLEFDENYRGCEGIMGREWCMTHVLTEK